MNNIMEWLNDNSGALTVIITFVYVVATIFIWNANKLSANATKEQLAESKRQFDEQNRPYMSCEYIFVNRTYCGIRFYNYGSKPAENVTFKINEEFLEIVKYKERFSKLNESVYLFGIGQHFDFFFSNSADFNSKSKVPFKVTIKYSCDGKEYSDNVEIPFDKQLPIESYNSFEDDILKEVKEQNDLLKKIANKK
ncbi:MAG: hypothetical protein ACI4JM_11390 [Oscillospiraceae bacterium]